MSRIKVWVQKFQDRENLVLQWYDPITGKRKSESTGTAVPQEAENKRADRESDLNNGRYQETSRMSWATFRELFEAEKLPGNRENTRRNYAQTFKDFEAICHPRQVGAITERTISAFLAGLRKKKGRQGEPLEPSTCRVRLLFLHAALLWAEEQKILPKCPKFPTVKVPKRRPQAVPAESFEKLTAKATDQQTVAFLLCGWLAGLRRNEALLLEWEETTKAPYLDFARNRILLPAAWVKGCEDQWLPIDPALRAVLEAMPRLGKKVFRFTDARGRKIGPEAVSRRISELAKRAGVKLSMRSLRRGFGCRYAGKVPAQVLQRLMRHASIATTISFYVNLDDALEEAVLGKRDPNLQLQIGGQAACNSPGSTQADAPVQLRDFSDVNLDKT